MFTPTILRFESIDSTNLEAMRRAKAGAAEGLCIIAREQTRGRGRLDRSWHSPKDAGLYFSIVLRPSFKLFLWPVITLAAALAVHDALAKAFQLTVDIKWPNDIVVGDRKLAGILAETVETQDGAAVVLGIGINLTSENFPMRLRKLATSIAEVTKFPGNRKSLIAELIKSLNRRYEMLQADGGGEQIVQHWCASSSYAHDRHVLVALADESFEGVTRGLETDGALRVETSQGAIKIVRAGDVTALRAKTEKNSDNDR
jgi:BirA family biotin operon repressor/biotin-[acetyl-CoA-carboxylase] ligase